ncbi:MAG: DUF4340 domain-containing protein [Endomicrobiia bacterium]
MKNYIRWLILITILLGIFFVRLFKRTYSFSKKIFKNKEVVEIEFTSLDNKNINIKKEANTWKVKTLAKSYPPNENLIKELVEKINKFELLDVVTEDPKRYEEYLVNEASATVVKIFFKKEKKPKIVYFGKTGGFSFNEIYVRIEKDPKVYLAKGISSFNFKNYFYEFCDKTVLKSNVDEIETISIDFQNKILSFKKELKDSTTSWINLKTSKSVELQKIDNFLRLFSIFTSDVILEETDLEDVKKLKIDFKIAIDFKDKSKIELTFYKEQKIRDIPVYPVKITYTTKPSSVEVIGVEDIMYGVYRYKYDDFTNRITPLK